MKTVTLAAALALGGCAGLQSKAVTRLATPPGQLFCALVLDGGGQITVGIIDAAAAGAGAVGSAAVVMAAGAASEIVQADCRLAAAAVKAKAGVPVVPPPVPVANVAINPA